ncbi:LysR family transcriptional regulator [Pseudooceanicola sp. HF7]|uniref:LysR family transcriptional regulator n=1 Tax=Pseudooceanicola sp. HF7 TaxID=2721560 RepID=UPI001431B17B|nr:LysR family transcriptional regulator [Pseudooceanicola sp. HF7]NIZ11149.1 LysR family transcriptional regulator [Pseudooceanicola sp. HF7]
MDRLTEMEAFANVVDQGGFTDAAKKMGISKSAVSKYISALEARLGARLLNRTTRRVSPTEIGLAYYDRARNVLTQAGEADALVTAMQSAPSGRLRISVATELGAHHLSPLLGRFLADCPDVTVNMELSNRYVELVSEGYDLAVRIGDPGHDSGLQRRKLAETSRRLVASPEYLGRHGVPERIEDLNHHKLLHYSQDGSGNVWTLTAPSGAQRQVRSAGWLSVNDGQSLLNAAMAGLGIAYLPGFLCAAALREGRLAEVLPDLPEERMSICAVYPEGRFTQPKVRAFVEFLESSFAAQADAGW